MPRVHDDELEIDEELVRALLREQFPEWADLSLERAGDGTVNVIYRLGEDLSLRLPRRKGPTSADDPEGRVLETLALQLPIEIPRVVARGCPGAAYPWFWSVHTWLDGDLPATDLPLAEVAGLVEALQCADTKGAPDPDYGRGGPLAARDEAVRDALRRVEAPSALERWDLAMRAPEWEGKRVWIHADLDRRNVLVRGGRLAAVLDWGGAGIGDPAVDLMVAWKLLASDDRERFRRVLEVDDATWLRAEGWVLSQALIALGYYTPENNPPIHAEATRWLAAVLDG